MREYRDSIEILPSSVPLLGGSNGGPVQLSRFFDVQSELGANGPFQILLQPTSKLIVPSTYKEESVPGFCVGLHPSSQSPVAIQFKSSSGSQAGTQVLVLKPGQVVRPFSDPTTPFSGFAWGLPFGWLGGGFTTLLVFPSPDAGMEWPGTAELMFHRERLKVWPAASVLVTTGAGNLVSPNWPTRFPWANAVRQVGAAFVSQQGNAVLSVTPSKTIIKLYNVAGLAAPATVRLAFFNSDDFNRTAAGFVEAPQAPFTDITFQAYAALGGTIDAVAPVQGPLIYLDDAFSRLGGDNLIMVPYSVDGLTDNQYIDIERWGVL